MEASREAAREAAKARREAARDDKDDNEASQDTPPKRSKDGKSVPKGKKEQFDWSQDY